MNYEFLNIKENQFHDLSIPASFKDNISESESSISHNKQTSMTEFLNCPTFCKMNYF